jgi:hypothetical protein
MVKRGRIDEAKAIMAILEDLALDSDIVAEDIRKMQVSLAESGKESFRDLIHNGDERLLNRTFSQCSAPSLSR